jgi:N-acetylglucosamine kinase-like BadF-type ATPase
LICIADIGASKSHWRIVSNNQEALDIHLKGFNFSNDDLDHLKFPPIKAELARDIHSVYIFGAGYDAKLHEKKLKINLKRTFSNIAFYYLQHDLMAACLATAGKNSGIVNILGTGSNACSYNGYEITHKMEPLGYILGDEGGGFQIGKILLNDFFNQRMPADMSKAFADQFNPMKSDVLNRVYKSANAKSYVASFARFFSEMRNPYTNKIMSTVFDSFIEKYLHPLHEKNPLPIYFVGSIAKIHSSVLVERLNRRKLTCKKILKDPMEALSHFILNNPNHLDEKRN